VGEWDAGVDDCDGTVGVGSSRSWPNPEISVKSA
jgi:hypothetical protein